jgi:hypothetical protein
VIQRLAIRDCCSVFFVPVKGIPGTLQGCGAAFATTHWSVVEACAEDDENAERALARLCQDYWPLLYTFARRRGNGSADAQNLAQGFFAYLLQSKAYTQTDHRKGKFRLFLLAFFKNALTPRRAAEPRHRRPLQHPHQRLRQQLLLLRQLRHRHLHRLQRLLLHLRPCRSRCTRVVTKYTACKRWISSGVGRPRVSSTSIATAR